MGILRRLFGFKYEKERLPDLSSRSTTSPRPNSIIDSATTSQLLFELQTAARAGNSEKCRELLNNGIAADEMDRTGWTPLMTAAEYGHLNVVQLLVNSGAEVNQRNHFGRTSLNIAAAKGHTPIIEFLILHQAQVDSIDSQGNTPLATAVRESHFESVKVLLKAGGNPYHCPAVEGLRMSVLKFAYSARHLACESNQSETIGQSERIIDLLTDTIDSMSVGSRIRDLLAKGAPAGAMSICCPKCAMEFHLGMSAAWNGSWVEVPTIEAVYRLLGNETKYPDPCQVFIVFKFEQVSAGWRILGSSLDTPFICKKCDSHLLRAPRC